VHILFSPTGSDATGNHRIIYPLNALSKSESKIKTSYEILVSSKLEEQLSRAAFVLLQCLAGPQQHQLLDRIHRAGKKVIIDYDDDMSSLSDIKLKEARMSQDEITTNWIKYLQTADLITVTTEMLAKRIRELTSTSVKVLPNLIRREDFLLTKDYDPFQQSRTNIRILYTASESHKKDFEYILPILKWVGEHYPITIISQGSLDFIYSCPKYRGAAQHVPACEYGSYYQRLMELNPHIIIAPLRATPLNVCRSNLKFLQAGVLKTAFIGTNLPPYQSIPKKSAILTTSKLGWWWNLRKLIKDWDKIKYLGSQANKEVEKNILEDHIHLWSDVYQDLYDS